MRAYFKPRISSRAVSYPALLLRVGDGGDLLIYLFIGWSIYWIIEICLGDIGSSFSDEILWSFLTTLKKSVILRLTLIYS